MSNDVTAPGALAAALDAAATAVRKGDTLGEAVKALKVPAAALGGCDPASARGGALLRPVARRRGGGALLELLPVLDGDAVIVAAPEVDDEPPPRAPARPWGAMAGFGYHDDDESESEAESDGSGSDLGASESERGSSAEDEESEHSSGGAGSSVGEDDATEEAASVAEDKGKAASDIEEESDGDDDDEEEDEDEDEEQPYPVAVKPQPRKAPSPPPRPPAPATVALAAEAPPPAAAVASAAAAASSPPPPPITLPLRLAFLHSEVVSLSGKVGGPETAAVEGTLILKGSFAEPLPPALVEAGFPPTPLRVRLRAGAPLASLTYTPAASAPAAAPAAAAVVLVPAPGAAPPTSPALVDVELTVPGRPPRGGAAAVPTSSSSAPQVFELGTLHYKLAPGFAPPQVVRAQASCKFTFVPAPAPAPAPASAAAAEGEHPAGEGEAPQPQPAATPQPQQLHRFTDVLLKAVVHPSVAAIAPGAQLLVQLPPPALKPPHGAAHAAGVAPTDAAAAYEAPQMRPSGQWNAQRAQILWAVTDASAAAAATGADSAAAAAAANGPATTATHLVPGKPCEWKARVPVAHGLRLDDAAPYASIVALPLQVRLSLPGAALSPVVIEAIGDDDGAAAAVADAPLRLTLASVATKAQSRLTALYR